MRTLTFSFFLLALLAWTAPFATAGAPTQAKLQAAAKAAGSVNGLCPVMGRLVTPTGGSAVYMGEKVGFCCKGCAAKFNADPTRYMDLMRMNPPKYWYVTKKPSVVAMRKAKAAVKSANGRCPVMGNLVVAKGGTSIYRGQTIQFCCPGCKPRFDKNPEKYMRIMRADPLAYEYDRPGPTSRQMREARKKLATANGRCPVNGELVVAAGGAMLYNGERIGFNCATCMATFQKNPEVYMKRVRAEPAFYGYMPSAVPAKKN